MDVEVTNNVDVPKTEVTVNPIPGPKGDPGDRGEKGDKGDKGEASDVNVTVEQPKKPNRATIQHDDGSTSTVEFPDD